VWPDTSLQPSFAPPSLISPTGGYDVVWLVSQIPCYRRLRAHQRLSHWELLKALFFDLTTRGNPMVSTGLLGRVSARPLVFSFSISTAFTCAQIFFGGGISRFLLLPGAGSFGAPLLACSFASRWFTTFGVIRHPPLGHTAATGRPLWRLGWLFFFCLSLIIFFHKAFLF